MKVRKPLVFVASILTLSALSSDVVAKKKNDPPTDAAIAFATETSDLMTATVVAALVQEIGETTPENAAHGSLSISLIFDDDNHNMRLVGDLEPLRDNDYPRDDFEDEALDEALNGQPLTSVEKVHGQWYYRRSIPLSNFAPQCATCHENFADLAATEYVGALMLRIPIED